MLPKTIEQAYWKTRWAAGRRAKALFPRAWRSVRGGPQADRSFPTGYRLDRISSTGEGLTRLRLREDSRPARALMAGRYVKPRFVDHAAYQPPPEDVVFVMVCNDKYAPGLEALLLSLRRTYPGLRNKVVVFHDGNLSPLNQDRISGIHPQVEYRRGDPDRFRVSMGEHENHARVGLLGYLTLDALAMEEPSYVVILDSDLIVLGDISPLWTHDKVAITRDIGALPFGVVSDVRGKPVMNSGVISLPRSERGPAAVARADAVLAGLDADTDESIARFADQKFWNVYLWERDVELLPQNFNTIKTLLSPTYRYEIGNAKILHLTGPKPWYAFQHDSLLTEQDRVDYEKGRKRFSETFTLWDQVYRSELVNSRVQRFVAEEGAALEELRGSAAGRPTALIGNGPSIARTDLSAFDGYEKVVFNWFPRFDGFDDFAPEHLVIASHMLFGGWHVPRPELPREYLDMLLARRHRPTIWTSFYFKPYLETVPELAEFDIRYVLFEKPLKRTIAATGVAQLDLLQPLTDANTGVLTVGVPLALHLGAREIVLAGCDSNYSSASGSYFYPAEQHASATTRSSTLLRTWTEGGEGLYGYAVTEAELRDRGVGFHDATVDGRLALPKLDLAGVRALRSSVTAG